jgi:hypothetical protein
MEEFPGAVVYNTRKENSIMKKTVLMGLALLLIATSAVLLAAVNVTGDWEMTSKMRNGNERKSTITFTQDGEKLTVKTTGRNGEEITGTGTVKGDDIEWSITRNGPQGEFTMTYKGKVEGDKMSGTSQFGDRPGIEWSAVRKPK